MATNRQILSNWSHLQDDFATSANDFYEHVGEAVKAREVPDCEFSRVEFTEKGIGSAKREYLRIRRRNVSYDLCAAPYGTGFFFSSWLVKPGPKHPWVWLLGFFIVIMVWLSIMMGLIGSSIERALAGGGSGSGCLLFFGALGLPALLWGFCWVVREGHMAIDEDDILMIPVLGFVYRLFFDPLSYFQLDSAAMFHESIHRAVGETLNQCLVDQGSKALGDELLRASFRDPTA